MPNELILVFGRGFFRWFTVWRLILCLPFILVFVVFGVLENRWCGLFFFEGGRGCYPLLGGFFGLLGGMVLALVFEWVLGRMYAGTTAGSRGLFVLVSVGMSPVVLLGGHGGYEVVWSAVLFFLMLGFGFLPPGFRLWRILCGMGCGYLLMGMQAMYVWLIFPIWLLGFFTSFRDSSVGVGSSRLIFGLVVVLSLLHLLRCAGAFWHVGGGGFIWIVGNCLQIFICLIHFGFWSLWPLLLFLFRCTDLLPVFRRGLMVGVLCYWLGVGWVGMLNLGQILPVFLVFMLLLYPSWDRFFAYGHSYVGFGRMRIVLVMMLIFQAISIGMFLWVK